LVYREIVPFEGNQEIVLSFYEVDRKKSKDFCLNFYEILTFDINFRQFELSHRSHKVLICKKVKQDLFVLFREEEFIVFNDLVQESEALKEQFEAKNAL
jgi:hypothetical protein